MATVAELKVAIGADISEFNKKFAEVSKSMEGIGKKMSAVGKSMSTYVTLPLLAAGAASIKMASDVDKGLREVNTLLADSEKDFAGLQSGVADLSKEIGVAQDTLTGGLYSAISAGVPKGNVFEFMKVAAKAAIGGVTDTETAIDGITTTINAFGLDFSEAEAVADSMFAAVQGGKTTFEELSASMSNVAGAAASSKIPFTEVNAAIATLTAAGTPTAQATNQIRAAIEAMQKPTDGMTKVFTDLGFASAQQAIAQKGLGFALNAVKTASNGSNGALTMLLGSSEAVAAANILAGTGAAKFADEMIRQANSAGAAQGAFDEMEKSNSRAMEKMAVGMANAGIAIGNILLPFVTKLANMISELVNWFTSLDVSTKKWIVGIAGAASAIGPLLVVLGFFVTSIVPAVVAGFGTITKNISRLGRATGITTIFQKGLNAAFKANPIGLIITGITLLVTAFVLLYKNSETFRNSLNGLWAAIKQIGAGLGSLGSLISAAMSGSFDKIPELFKKMKSDFGKVGSEAGKGFSSEFDKAAALKSMGSAAKKKAEEDAASIASAAAEAAKNIIPDIENTGEKLGSALGEGFVGYIKTELPRVMSGVMKSIKVPELKQMNMGAMGDSSDAEMVFGAGFEDLDPNIEAEEEEEKSGKGAAIKKAIINAVKSMASSFSTMIKGMASTFTGQMDNFGGSFDSLMSGDVIGAIVGVFGEFAKQSEAFSDLMALMNTAISGVMKVFMPVFDQLVFAMRPLIGIVTTISTMFSDTLMGILKAITKPLVSILLLITELAPVITQLSNAISGAIGKALKMVVTHLKPLIPIIITVIAVLTDLIPSIMQVVSLMVKILYPSFLMFIDMLEAAIPILQLLAPLIDLLYWSVMLLMPVFELLALSLTPIVWLLGLLGQAITALLGKLGMGGGSPSISMPALAKGGIVTGPTTALIGEAGPEAVIPLSKLGSMGGGGGNVTFRIQGTDLIGVIDQANRTGNRIG